jgi:hypothetical protein
MGLGVLMSCAQGKRASETGPRQKPRSMCTHETHFLAAVGTILRRAPHGVQPLPRASKEGRPPIGDRPSTSRLRCLYSVK